MPDAVFRTDFGYECRYTPTIMSGPVFRWSWPGVASFEVAASRDGVMVQGYSPPMDADGVSNLIALLQLAWRVYRQLQDHTGPADVRFHHPTRDGGTTDCD